MSEGGDRKASERKVSEGGDRKASEKKVSEDRKASERKVSEGVDKKASESKVSEGGDRKALEVKNEGAKKEAGGEEGDKNAKTTEAKKEGGEVKKEGGEVKKAVAEVKKAAAEVKKAEDEDVAIIRSVLSVQHVPVVATMAWDKLQFLLGSLCDRISSQVPDQRSLSVVKFQQTVLLFALSLRIAHVCRKCIKFELSHLLVVR
jgi:hypothetical protein